MQTNFKIDIMKLEEKDRLILINQYKILSSLNKDDEKHYSEKIEILENGYEKIYESLIENFASTPLSVDECNFVMDVLEMYGTGITLSFHNLKSKTLTELDIHFPGFNTNEEINYYSFALYWLETLDRYGEIQEISKGKYRGIGQNADRYRTMIKKWKEFERYNLSEEQIRELLNLR